MVISRLKAFGLLPWNACIGTTTFLNEGFDPE
jgi:hypothetical protein